MKLSLRVLATSTVALTAAFAAAVTLGGTAGGDPASDPHVATVGAPQGPPATAKPVNIWGP
ncbi:hypothetical protein [Streptomyces griseoflavus]|uniref:hypothetical protein n=1 Tax=Streptomyces griseoflavus TaxID=35619 RepID=UPI003D761255